MTYAHIEHTSIRRALENKAFDDAAHAEECFILTAEAFYVDATDPQFKDSPARNAALKDMVKSEILGDNSLKGLEKFWSN